MRTRHQITASRSRAIAAAIIVVTAATAWAHAGLMLWKQPLAPGVQIAGVATASLAALVLDTDGGIHARSARNGTVLWDAPGDPGNVVLHSLAARSMTAAVAGDSHVGGDDAYAQAMDVMTGQVRWTTLYGQGDGLAESFSGIALTSSYVIFSGSAEDALHMTHGALVALDRRTGAVVWEHRDLGATIHAISGSNAIVALAGQSTDGKAWFGLFDTRSGSEIGEATYDSGAATSTYDSITLSKRGLVAGGSTDEAGYTQALVSGADLGANVLWSHAIGFAAGTSQVRGTAIGSGIAVVGGDEIADLGVGDSNGFVRAYDLATGTLVWSRTRDGGGHGDTVRQLVGTGLLVVVCGASSDPTDQLDVDVAGINIRTGKQMWSATPDSPTVDDSCQGFAMLGMRGFYGIDTTPVSALVGMYTQ